MTGKIVEIDKAGAPRRPSTFYLMLLCTTERPRSLRVYDAADRAIEGTFIELGIPAGEFFETHPDNLGARYGDAMLAWLRDTLAKKFPA